MRWIHAAGRGLLVLVVILTGYVASGARADEGPAGGRGPLTLATAGDLTGYLGSVLEGWNRTHPGEKVTLVELPDSADETHAQMTTDLRGGDRSRFDILNIDVNWTSEFAAHGWIRPLARDRFPLDTFLPPVVDTATYDGQLYAVPYVTNAGLLLYRKDILAKEGLDPPRTWAELEKQAKTVAPKYGLDGYAGQFLPYEGLTVNAAEAVYSAGGSILGDEGERVTVNSMAARDGIDFLARGVREGWIPKQALTYKEEESKRAFQDGRLLFLRNWPYAYVGASAAGSPVAGKIGAVPLPGPDGPGTSVLGGSNLAVSTHARHPDSAARLLAYLTSERVQRQVLTRGALPPVRADLYEDPALVREFPYLPTLRESVRTAAPRPKSPRYDQVSLVVQAIVHDAMTGRETPEAAVRRLARELDAVAR
ncbi:ABC transporter substrate-binding protein [Streptomyces chartreusis]|uniref:ABC transporter substrate-binding protein n=1 Tax=Streptomyces chartreusis TaxID=1969 RepID=A0A7H8TH56_STRCX|nr:MULTISPECIES: ABC transporter substrate-binding protein [Streptomyces]MBT1097064.1 ABC transporter substrate-binding protein [Streptomyces sp. Tu102]QEV70948.1 ABC transporter substrate-binding protein [Streptomyces chartreusis]QKZ22368.1 ABC transporter substrate-binding protein [Streptomyces chartreusis]RSO08747.1 ABC transporter substrate-binding protein [Streptomyces sp. WAC 05379]GGX41440.1 ABC transporter substrate-binding protein [Streptomyces chartreusis]